MRRLHEAIGAVETYSPAEERFNRRRRTVGLFLAPAVLLLVLAAAAAGSRRRRTAWPRSWRLVVVLWVTEALPMAVTAVLGPVLAVVFQVADARAARWRRSPIRSSSCSSAASSWPRRCSCTAWIGASPSRAVVAVRRLERRRAMLVVYGAVATVISMWISNTATTAMMFPIGLSIVSHLMRLAPRDDAAPDAVRRFALGTDADDVVRRVGRRHGDAGRHAAEPDRHRHARAHRAACRVSFFAWMALGVPLVLVLFGAARRAASRATARAACASGEGGVDLVRDELARLGPWSRGRAQRRSSPSASPCCCGSRRGCWRSPGWTTRAFAAGVRDGGARGRRRACIGALLLFVLPVDWRQRRFTLTWDEAVADRLGHRPALRRRAGAGRAGVLDRAGRRARARHHGLAAVAHGSWR